MKVPENEAFILHEKRITTFADMARNLNPLSYDDFLKHRPHVIKWVEHSGKDKYLANKLKDTKDKKEFVKLLALRNNIEEAKYPKETIKKIEKINVENKLEEVKTKLKTTEEIPKPNNFSDYKPKINLDFDIEDFNKILDEAKHYIKSKHYEEAITTYKLLKKEFENAKLPYEQKKELHKKIKEIYSMMESIN